MESNKSAEISDNAFPISSATTHILIKYLTHNLKLAYLNSEL